MISVDRWFRAKNITKESIQRQAQLQEILS